MSASIEWDGMEETRRLLKSLTEKTDNLKPLLQEVGGNLVSSTKSRLRDDKKSPDGQKWQDYKNPNYAAIKKAGIERKNREPGQDKWLLEPSEGGLLEYSGLLIQSITCNASKNKLEVGSRKEYAARHQFGGGGIPARPFLGISRDDNEVIVDLIKQYYEK
ncbi:MAG: phage virion morphogenesis protein [Gammaproteobacteria bacterium]|nr:phage virion morphogenesis protein [Gammaproteobacteria bacterium]